MVKDQFGMAGLLQFMRAAETNTTLDALNPGPPGIDINTIGLNLTSEEKLLPTFQSPLTDGPARPQDIDMQIQPEYMTNQLIQDKLPPISNFQPYDEDLLFCLFYMNPGDVLQLAVAAELYNKQNSKSSS